MYEYSRNMIISTICLAMLMNMCKGIYMLHRYEAMIWKWDTSIYKLFSCDAFFTPVFSEVLRVVSCLQMVMDHWMEHQAMPMIFPRKSGFDGWQLAEISATSWPSNHWNFKLHPGRLTWDLQITHLERKMIFQTSMTMFHVNLQGCNFVGSKIDPRSWGMKRETSFPKVVNLHVQC